MDDTVLLDLAVALGIGLLIGAERERRKQEVAGASAAGIRTFAVVSMSGALAFLIGGAMLLAVCVVAVSILVALGYWRTRDSSDAGLTTEAALLLTVLLGALSMQEPLLAAGCGVVGAILLAARTPLHHFVSSVLTQEEVRAALMLAGATLVVLPLLPDRPLGPFGALNPRAIWLVVILVLAIGAAGHLATRTLGARFGLPLAGLASGFVSSAATIGAMGARARLTPALSGAASAGAVLSTVATLIQMAMVVGATSMPTLVEMGPSLGIAGLAAVLYGAVFTLRALREAPQEAPVQGEAFSLRTALLFAAMVSIVMVCAAALQATFGDAGLLLGAAVAGLVDTHAAAISVAALVASGHLEPQAAVIPILAALTTNTVTKIALALSGGGRAFTLRVAPGLLLVAFCAWAGALLVPSGAVLGR